MSHTAYTNIYVHDTFNTEFNDILNVIIMCYSILLPNGG